MSSDFWTTKSYLPYQSHNFQVDLQLYAITEEAYYGAGSQLDSGARPLDEEQRITANDVQLVEIPSWAIKNIDMPTVELAIEKTGGNLSVEQPSQAQDQNYQDINIVFYAVDTPSGNIIKLLPRIFSAYYLVFDENTGTAKIPFRYQFDRNAPPVNKSVCARSSIVINMFKGSRTSISNPALAVASAFNPFAAIAAQLPSTQILLPRFPSNKQSISYRAVAPISYDIGNLSYGESEVVECTMAFRYNLSEGKDATTPIGGPPPEDGGGFD